MINLIISPLTLFASPSLGPKKSAAPSNLCLYPSTSPDSIDWTQPWAEMQNSRSSARMERKVMAAWMASVSKEGVRKTYSVIPRRILVERAVIFSESEPKN